VKGYNFGDHPGGTLPPDSGHDESLETAEQLSSVYVGYVAADGTVSTLFTPSLTGQSPPLPQIDGAQALARADTGKAFTVGSVGSERRYRVVARTDDRLAGVVVVALPLDDVDDAVSRLLAIEAVATLIALVVLSVVTWWVIRLGVRPIKQMTATATAIAGGDLSHRAPEAQPNTEAGELSTALNQMLTRIEESFAERTRSEERLRQFVADASHELRTPVTTIRGYAELYEWPR